MSELNPKLIQLTSVLSDCKYHDGDSLGKKLQVTRSAVWKMIKKLTDYGVSITSIKGKGYKLDTPLLLMNHEQIISKLPKKLKNNIQLEVYETIDSTNEYLKKNFNPKKISVCISECQEHGKGRLGRSWFSPFGKNLFVSCRIRIEKDICELGGLTLAVSVATMNTLKKFGIESKIKWPNDVYCNNKKISGNLVEIFAESNNAADVIIGIGLNINMDDIEASDTLSWTSIKKEINETIDRNEVAVELISQLYEQIEIFTNKGIAHFLNIVDKNNYLKNKKVTIEQYKKTFCGVVSGIDEQGRLLVTLNDGAQRHFSSGDAHIKR